jgi:hypothetical protein
MESQIVKMTPSLAHALLAASPRAVRRVSRHFVASMADCMSDARWSEGSLPPEIVLNEEGILLDGRQVLMAVTMAKKTISVELISGASNPDWIAETALRIDK